MRGGVKRFKNQDYDRIKSQLRHDHRLFTDPEFPPNDRSLWYDAPRLADVEWRRIGALCHDPRFIIDGGVPNEKSIVQGSLGDCWLMAALTAMTRHRRLWRRVVPNAGEQDWDERRPGAYRGIFRFRFWHFGRWYEVVVDDYLPTRNDRLVFARSKNENEFWCALLEKAYAKFHGCYERLISGSLAEALVDISGGVPENINLTDPIFKSAEQRRTLQKRLKEALDCKALILAAARAKNGLEMEKETSEGLLKGHAYSVSGLRTLRMDGGSKASSGLRDFFKTVFKQKDRIDLIRLRNPWGRKEWTGAWAHGSVEWRRVGSLQRRKATSVFTESNGEFWMAFDDFMDNFGGVTICHCHFRRAYVEHAFAGQWRIGSGAEKPEELRAGGSVNEQDTFLCNPQYLVKVDGGRRMIAGKNDLIVSLLQSHSAVDEDQGRVRKRTSALSIGVTVIRVENNRKYRLHQLRGLDPVAMTDFVNCRSNYLRLSNLPAGNYVIIPSTYQAREETDFYLRVYAHSRSNLAVSHLRTDGPPTYEKIPDWCCLPWTKPFVVVTRVRVLFGKDLTPTHLNGYFIELRTEKLRFRSRIIRNTTEPHWNWTTLIYRRSGSSPLTLSVWASGASCCGFSEHLRMGRVEIETPVDDKFWQYTMTVMDARRLSIGTIALTVSSSADCAFGL